MGSEMGFYLHLGNLCRQSKVRWSKQGSRMRASTAKHRDPRIPTLKSIKDSQRFRELTEIASKSGQQTQRNSQRQTHRDSEKLRAFTETHQRNQIQSGASRSCLDRFQDESKESLLKPKIKPSPQKN